MCLMLSTIPAESAGRQHSEGGREVNRTTLERLSVPPHNGSKPAANASSKTPRLRSAYGFLVGGTAALGQALGRDWRARQSGDEGNGSVQNDTAPSNAAEPSERLMGSDVGLEVFEEWVHRVDSGRYADRTEDAFAEGTGAPSQTRRTAEREQAYKRFLPGRLISELGARESGASRRAGHTSSTAPKVTAALSKTFHGGSLEASLSRVSVLLGIIMMCAVCCCMMPGGMVPPPGAIAGPAAVPAAGVGGVMRARSVRVPDPPGWGPDQERRNPFTRWI